MYNQYSFRVQTKVQLLLFLNRAPISALAFSSEGTWLVSASKDCNVLIWDTKTWQVVRRLETGVGKYKMIRFN